MEDKKPKTAEDYAAIGCSAIGIILIILAAPLFFYCAMLALKMITQ